MWNIWRWSRKGMMEKNSITIVKWTNRVWKWGEKKGGWEFSLESGKPLAHTARRRGGGRPRLRLYRFPVARMRERVSFGSTFFFFSLYFFPYFSSPSLSVRSSLYQRSNDRADICVAVIEQHCFGKNLFHGIVRPRCNCAVLMSEEDVRWYRNVSFRMIDDTEM